MVRRKTRNTVSLLVVLVAATALVLPSPVVEGMPREGGQTTVTKAPPSLVPVAFFQRLLDWLELQPNTGDSVEDASRVSPADSESSEPRDATPQIGSDMDPDG